MKNIRPYLRAILVAPWIVVPVIVVSGLGTSDAGIASDFGVGLFFSVIGGVPLAYLGMLSIGIPSYIVLRQLKAANPFILVLLGFAVPFCFAVGGPNLGFALLFGVCGAAVALSAWLLLPTKAKCTSRTPGVENEV